MMFLLPILVLSSMTTSTFGIAIEDLMGMAAFPPLVPKPTDGQPPGHLKPFGWQRKPEGPIKEYTEALDARQFWTDHVSKKIPLVYRGYLKSSPAIDKWTDKYLSDKYGDLDVLVEHKREDRQSSSGRMRLSDFLLHYNDSDMYVVSMLPTEMMSEIRAVPSVLCGTFRKNTHESNFWVSSGGTRSVIHYDADHNIHCILAGRKDFMMVNNNITTKTNLYYKKKNPSAGSGFSFLDPDRIDMQKFKRIADVPWTWATLYPGDCIFIPSQYIHQVRGYGRTVAVTTLFTADVANKFNGDDCTADIMERYHSMDEIPFQWTYKKGDPTIDMGYMNVELVRQPFRDILLNDKVQQRGGVSKKMFQIVAGRLSPLGRNTTKTGLVWTEVFKFADDYRMVFADIDRLTLEQWKVLARAIESPHGVVTDGTQPVFVRPGERHHYDSEEDDEQYLSKEEKRERKIAEHDPLLDHLTGAEREAYIKERKEKRKRLGVKSNPDAGYDGDDEDDDDGDNDIWASELGWTLDEIPREYREEMMHGRIPLDFKEDFLNSLSDVIKERFKKDFDDNIVPRELIREWGVGEDEEEDYDDDERMKENLSKIPPRYLKEILQGRIPDEFKINFLDILDDGLVEMYRKELVKNVVPEDLLEWIRTLIPGEGIESRNSKNQELEYNDNEKKLSGKDEL